MTGITVLTFKLIVLCWVIAKRQLIHNRSAQRDNWNQSYDFIVVGAGAGGCVVAHRLAQDPNVNVLLLEAGGAQDAFYNDIVWLPSIISENRPSLVWQYYDEPQANAGGSFPQRRINEFMGKSIGGSTSHNGIAFNRGNPRDFDRWVKEYGAIGWGYKEVMPYFLKYENNTDPIVVSRNPSYHNVGGLVQISSQKYRPRLMKLIERAVNDLGYYTTDFNGPNQTGVSFIQQFKDSHGYRVTAGTAFVDPNPYQKNLHIVTRAQVLRVLFNGTTAIGVEFNRNDSLFNVYTRREVILSAGAYNSPQLLMLSGVGLKKHLQSFGIPVLIELPVGNNLANHPSVGLSFAITDPNYYWPQRSLSLQEINELYFKKGGPLSEFAEITLMYKTANNPDINYPNSLIFNLMSNDGQSLLASIINSRVQSRGSVRLQSRSPYIAPRIDPNYYSDPRDFEDILDALRFIMFIYGNPTFGVDPIIRFPSLTDMGCPDCPQQSLYNCTESLKCIIRYSTASSYHPGGTCRMGAITRNDVVVDPSLRVKNLNNLRVCDASIFPIVPNGNPAAAVLMVGEKCAQFIENSYKPNPY